MEESSDSCIDLTFYQYAMGCDVTVSPNLFAFFVFFLGWATLRAHNFKTIRNFKIIFKPSNSAHQKLYFKAKKSILTFWFERPFNLFITRTIDGSSLNSCGNLLKIAVPWQYANFLNISVLTFGKHNKDLLPRVFMLWLIVILIWW